jgi:hypothetical protein
MQLLPPLPTVVTLTDGLLFTATPTQPSKIAVMLRRPNGRRKHLNRIAAEIGVFIQLAAMQSVTLKWTDQTLTLEKGGGSGQGYLIEIDNGPVNETDHDDFEAYYDLGIDTSQPHFGMDFYRRIGVEAGDNVDSPCMSGTLDGDGRDGN